MPWARPRLPLFTAAVLDAIGLVVLALALVSGFHDEVSGMQPQGGSLAVLVLIYCSLGWLFGSYTLLKLQKPSWIQVVARLSSTTIVSLVVAVAYGYVFRLQITDILFFRNNLIPLFVLLTLWSGLVRLVLRRSWPVNQQTRWRIVALPHEIAALRAEWNNSASPCPLPTITDISSQTQACELADSEALAISAGVMSDEALKQFCQEAVNRGQSVTSLVELAEQILQRIPSRWIDQQWLLFTGSIDGQRVTLQKQLKRYADVVVSLALLIISSPVLAMACILVKLQDGGAVIYRQKRSGLLGETFDILKIRTMSSDAESDGAQWTQTNDKRITPVGYWLRRTRLDELPQLINVVRGEMSLIGPRPERPDLEKWLEDNIPNYRLRHWMRPGLSGWAQVNMPYASSISDSEMKLSYDLFYLRNATVWLDLLIMFKTIKIVLKAAGR